MPELPEVEVTRRGLLPHISGRVISGVEVRDARLRCLLPPGTPAGKHDHFDLLLGDRILRLRDPRRFGAVLWTSGRLEAHPLLAHLGLEPLSRSEERRVG